MKISRRTTKRRSTNASRLILCDYPTDSPDACWYPSQTGVVPLRTTHRMRARKCIQNQNLERFDVLPEKSAEILTTTSFPLSSARAAVYGDDLPSPSRTAAEKPSSPPLTRRSSSPATEAAPLRVAGVWSLVVLSPWMRGIVWIGAGFSPGCGEWERSGEEDMGNEARRASAGERYAYPKQQGRSRVGVGRVRWGRPFNLDRAVDKVSTRSVRMSSLII